MQWIAFSLGIKIASVNVTVNAQSHMGKETSCKEGISSL